MSRIKVLTILFIAAFQLLIGPAALAQVPKDDSDLREIEVQADDVWRYQLGDDYCCALSIRPRVNATISYLESMDGWLALATKDALLHLKSAKSEQILGSNQAAKLEEIIALQETLLQFSEKLTSVSSWFKDSQELLEELSGKDHLTLADIKSKWKDIKKVGSDAYAGGKDIFDRLDSADKTPELPQKFFPTSKRELIEKIKTEIPHNESALKDLIESREKIKGYIASAKELADLKDIKGLVAKWLTLAARWQQSKLLDELKELTDSIAAEEKPGSTALANYQRLCKRREELDKAIQLLNRIDFTSQPCLAKCTETEPTDLHYGEPPFPSQGLSYGTALRSYGAATTLKYASSLQAAKDKAKQRQYEAMIDPPWLRLTGGHTRLHQGVVGYDNGSYRTKTQSTLHYYVGETINFEAHSGKCCHGAAFRISSNDIQYAPFNGTISGKVPADRAGTYYASLQTDWSNVRYDPNKDYSSAHRPAFYPGYTEKYETIASSKMEGKDTTKLDQKLGRSILPPVDPQTPKAKEAVEFQVIDGKPEAEDLVDLSGEWIGTGYSCCSHASPNKFAGIWKTGYGRMQINVSDQGLASAECVDQGTGGSNRLQGIVSGTCFKGTYDEYSAPKDGGKWKSAGKFEFNLKNDGKQFDGNWTCTHSCGGSSGPWDGTRIALRPEDMTWHEQPAERIRIAQNGENITATKTTGDDCVKSGAITWQGNLRKTPGTGAFTYTSITTGKPYSFEVDVTVTDAPGGENYKISGMARLENFGTANQPHENRIVVTSNSKHARQVVYARGAKKVVLLNPQMMSSVSAYATIDSPSKLSIQE
jgi:hypothetical protein